ncbi:MAG: hypothetical protein ACMUIL_11195 [bacterium]
MYKRFLTILICLMSFIPCLIPTRIGNAAVPIISSIEPDLGINTEPTTITIRGSGFLPAPTVSLYGGGPYITGSYDTIIINGACDGHYYAHGIYIAGFYAYVADAYSELRVIDIIDPAHPAIVGLCDTSGVPYGVHVVGSYAYVAAGGSGVQVIDITDPEHPTIVGLLVLDQWNPLLNITYIDSSTITATVPEGYKPGVYNLHLTNQDGEHIMLRNSFQV